MMHFGYNGLMGLLVLAGDIWAILNIAQSSASNEKKLLWILVVVLLECELRYPHAVARRRRSFTAIAVVLYTSIAALVPFWALHGEWFDAYDAVLWLVSFWFIEMDVLKLAR